MCRVGLLVNESYGDYFASFHWIKNCSIFQSNLPVFRKGDLWLGLIKEKYARKRFFVAFLFALISREEVRSNQKWGFTGTSTTLRLLMNVIGVFSVDLIKILSKF